MEIEVFPIGCRVDGFTFWVAWKLSDDPSMSIIKSRNDLLWADSESGLREKIIEIGQNFSIGDSNFYDFDEICLALQKNEANFEQVINVLNFIDDFSKSILHEPQRNDLIIDNNLDLYDEVFPFSSAAGLLGVERLTVSDDSLMRVAAWISSASNSMRAVVGH